MACTSDRSNRLRPLIYLIILVGILLLSFALMQWRLGEPTLRQPSGSSGRKGCEFEATPLGRDSCYFSAFANAERHPKAQYDHSPCPAIANPYLLKLCDRITWRPHMRQFLSRRESMSHFPPPGSEQKDPHGFDQRLYRYLEASHATVSSEDRAVLLCRRATSLDEVDECLYYLVIAHSLRLVDAFSSTQTVIETLCEAMSIPEYRSECWFTLADELSTRTTEENFDRLIELCHRSTRARNYQCFDHLLFTLQEKGAGQAFCSRIPFPNHRHKCFHRLGWIWFKAHDRDTARFEPFCPGKLAPTDQLACNEGAALAYGQDLAVFDDFNTCAGLAAPYVRPCYQGMAEHYSPRRFLPAGCAHFPPEHRVTCLTRYFDLFFIDRTQTPSRCLDKCAEFPEQTELCLERLIQALRISYPEESIRRSRCALLPEPAAGRCQEP